MAGISFQTRITGKTIRTDMLAIGALVGSILGVTADPARGQWDSEPHASVLVEGGELSGHEPYQMSAMPDPSEGYVGNVDPTFGSADMTSGSCSGCCGTGCTSCCPDALFDTECPANRQGVWVGRVDAMLLWRDAPPDRPIATNDLSPGGVALDANGLDSTPAAGPRFTLMRVNNCTGHAVEVNYFQAANFRSERPLSAVSLPYALSPPGIYGSGPVPFASGTANLGSRIKSFELNRHHALGRNIRFVAGFRWIEWQEQFSLSTTGTPFLGDVFFRNNVNNDLYGGQIGLDGNIVATSWARLEGFIKAGAYYNNAAQSSFDSVSGGFQNTLAVGQSPASCAFAGDIGLTTVVPVTQNIDIRFGYYGLWLSGIAQPTQQLSGQFLSPFGGPVAGSLTTNGGVLVQGATVGLEGHW